MFCRSGGGGALAYSLEELEWIKEEYTDTALKSPMFWARLIRFLAWNLSRFSRVLVNFEE